MNNMSRTSIIKKCFYSVLVETRRYAGHSKWANIKHTKEAKDRARANLFRSLTQRMKVAIAGGGSAKPTENLRLSQLIEEAKRMNMPNSTLKNFLDKQSLSKESLIYAILPMRAPSGSIFIAHLLTNNLKHAKMMFKAKLKKHGVTIDDPVLKNSFMEKGFFTTEGTCNLEKAMEDAIFADAEDVEEVEEDGKKYFRFSCDPVAIPKVENKLTQLNYTIISSERVCLPHSTVELSDKDLEEASIIRDKLLEMDEVTKVDDNIA